MQESLHSNISGEGRTLPLLVPPVRTFHHPWPTPVLKDRTVWPLTSNPWPSTRAACTAVPFWWWLKNQLSMRDGSPSPLEAWDGKWDGKAMKEHEKNLHMAFLMDWACSEVLRIFPFWSKSLILGFHRDHHFLKLSKNRFTNAGE